MAHIQKRKKKKKPTAIDLFCGCGGLTLGLKSAGFRVLAAIDRDELAIKTYRSNHKSVHSIAADIKDIKPKRLMKTLGLKPGELSLLAGCPPCQGFSTLRTMNGARSVRDEMNDLVFHFIRFIRVLRPQAIMIENVPGLATNYRVREVAKRICKLGYKFDVKVLNAADFGVPQRRKRMVLIGSKAKKISFAEPLGIHPNVRSVIGKLRRPNHSRDPIHNYPVRRTKEVLEIIRRIPKNGGSRASLPKKYQLSCHQKTNGFKDIYGRMSWSQTAPTITGGCINPSKGRFLHPEQNRAITLREAALLQGFPRNYRFDLSKGCYPVAQLIGNAFPPAFAAHHARRIFESLR